MAFNFLAPAYQAIAGMIQHAETEPASGRYIALRALIDPGRGDIYIEEVCNLDNRVCIPAEGQIVATREGWGAEAADAHITYGPIVNASYVEQTARQLADSTGDMAEEFRAYMAMHARMAHADTMAQNLATLSSIWAYAQQLRAERKATPCTT